MSPLYTPSDDEINDPPPPLFPEKAKKLTEQRRRQSEFDKALNVMRIVAIVMIVTGSLLLLWAVVAWLLP